MIRWLGKHGLQILIAGAVVSAVFWVDYTFFFIDNVGVVEPGKLIRSPQPEGNDWRLLDQFNVRQLINLRTRGEDPEEFAETRAACRAADVTMVHIPVSSRLPDLGQIEDFLFAARREGATSLVHCQHGEDRTGMMLAAYRVVVNGWSVRKAMAEMRRFRGRKGKQSMRFLRLILHRLRMDRAYWLRKTDPTDVWVHRVSNSENERFCRLDAGVDGF